MKISVNQEIQEPQYEAKTFFRGSRGSRGTSLFSGMGVHTQPNFHAPTNVAGSTSTSSNQWCAMNQSYSPAFSTSQNNGVNYSSSQLFGATSPPYQPQGAGYSNNQSFGIFSSPSNQASSYQPPSLSSLPIRPPPPPSLFGSLPSPPPPTSQTQTYTTSMASRPLLPPPPPPPLFNQVPAPNSLPSISQYSLFSAIAPPPPIRGVLPPAPIKLSNSNPFSSPIIEKTTISPQCDLMDMCDNSPQHDLMDMSDN